MFDNTAKNFIALASILILTEGCRKGEQTVQEFPREEGEQPIQPSEAQRKRDSVLAIFATQLKTLDEKLQEARMRISESGKKGGKALPNKLRVVEARRGKLVDEAIDLEKRPDEDFAAKMSAIGESVELLSRDVDRFMKTKKKTGPASSMGF